MKTYAFSDLHGHLDLYKKIKEYVHPEDQLICLGDCGDRGPEPWETICAVYDDPQILYLKGNHEDMTAHAIIDMENCEEFPMLCYSAQLSVSNGGENTLTDLMLIQSEERLEWASRLQNLPIETTYINKDGLKIYLNHSGATEFADEEDKLWQRDFNFIDLETNYDLIVHGHTPVGLFSGWNHEDPHFHTANKRLCIDAGTYWSKYCYLLDLDTLEAIKIKE